LSKKKKKKPPTSRTTHKMARFFISSKKCPFNIKKVPSYELISFWS
jgi:hypothetical protein